MKELYESHPRPEDYMRDIERFLIQPKGSNLVVDESQPTIDISTDDQLSGGNRSPSYDDYLDYYEKYYYKSIRQEKIDTFLIILPLILGIGSGLLTIFAPTIISSLTNSDLPNWIYILAYPVGIAVGVGVGKLMNQAIIFFEVRVCIRYDKRIERMSNISIFTDDYKQQEERIQYKVIHYFERLHYWTESWSKNSEGDFYYLYLMQLHNLQHPDQKVPFTVNHYLGRRRNRKRRYFEKEDKLSRFIICVIGTIIGAMIGIVLWLDGDPPFIILLTTFYGFVITAFLCLTPNPF